MDEAVGGRGAVVLGSAEYKFGVTKLLAATALTCKDRTCTHWLLLRSSPTPPACHQ